MQSASEASMLDFGAAIHHHVEASVCGELCRVSVPKTELSPKGLCADVDRILSNLGQIFTCLLYTSDAADE